MNNPLTGEQWRHFGARLSSDTLSLYQDAVHNHQRFRSLYLIITADDY